MTFFVYVVQCVDGTLYTGYTTNIVRRLHEHNEGNNGAKYTKSRRPVVLKYSEKLKTKSHAMRREHEIKTLPRVEKMKLYASKK